MRKFIKFELATDQTRIYAETEHTDEGGKISYGSGIVLVIPQGCVIDPLGLKCLVEEANSASANRSASVDAEKRAKEAEERAAKGGVPVEKVREIVERFKAALDECRDNVDSAHRHADDASDSAGSAQSDADDARDYAEYAQGDCDKMQNAVDELEGLLEVGDESDTHEE